MNPASKLLFFALLLLTGCDSAPNVQSKPTSPDTVLFYVQCLDEHTIRITASGNIPDVDPPPTNSYPYMLHLVAIFDKIGMGQDNKIGISGTGYFSNPEHGTQTPIYPQTESHIGEGGISAKSFSNVWDIEFITTPNTPGIRRNGPISGSVDITISYPVNGLTLSGILKDCGTPGDVTWGLPDLDSHIVIGKYIIGCPCPCGQ